jgi:hypothetical protein
MFKSKPRAQGVPPGPYTGKITYALKAIQEGNEDKALKSLYL